MDVVCREGTNEKFKKNVVRKMQIIDFVFDKFDLRMCLIHFSEGFFEMVNIRYVAPKKVFFFEHTRKVGLMDSAFSSLFGSKQYNNHESPF